MHLFSIFFFLFVLSVLPFGLFQSFNYFSLHPSAGLLSLMTSWNMRWIRMWTTGGAQHNFLRWIDMSHLYFKTYNLRPHPHKLDLTWVRIAAASQRKSPLFTITLVCCSSTCCSRWPFLPHESAAISLSVSGTLCTSLHPKIWRQQRRFSFRGFK